LDGGGWYIEDVGRRLSALVEAGAATPSAGE
jgi:hypothetical protein